MARLARPRAARRRGPGAAPPPPAPGTWARQLVWILLVAGCGSTGSSPKAPKDTAPPTVRSALPRARQKIPADALITILFSEPVDPASVTSASVRLEGVAADLSSKCSAVSLQPRASLSLDASYTLTVAGVKDLAGNAMTTTWTRTFDTDSRVLAIGAGARHTLVLKKDGTVWAWGDNASGDLGAGTEGTSSTPVQTTGLANVQAVTGGLMTSLALARDGTVWAWGLNDHGQLGDGGTTPLASPVQVGGLTEVSAVRAGGSFSMAIKPDGTLWTWGGNGLGQLGRGLIEDKGPLGQVSGPKGVTAIGAGDTHALAVDAAGTVWAWGNNYGGQLGDGTTTRRDTPVPVGGLAGVADVAGGGRHSLALKGDGTVWAWGGNESGELGDGSTTSRSSPARVGKLVDVVAVAAGEEHSLALTQDGTVWAWGKNADGQLGDGSSTQRNRPVQVAGLSAVKAIATGMSHAVALAQGGAVWTWGANSAGQLGDGTLASRAAPGQVRWSSQLRGAPAAPRDVTLRPGVASISLSWVAVEGATSHIVYWSASADVSPTSGTRIDCAVEPLLLENLKPGKTYSFCVVASNPQGDSACSHVVSGTPEAPSQPSGDGCDIDNKCGTVVGGIAWMGTWVPEDCACPGGMIDEGGSQQNQLCGLPGSGYDCKYCSCP